MNPGEHPTTNIERPTSNDCAKPGLWRFDVGCWMLDVPSLRFRGFKHEICLSVSSLPGRGGERGGACHRLVLRAVAEENFVVKVSVQLLDRKSTRLNSSH